MSPDESFKEKRKDLRLDNNIPVKILQEEGDVVTETINISRSGAFCKVNKFIETMTKLKICLLLPLRKNGNNVTKKITCEGVVVRVEPAGNEFYNVAIFFNDIAKRDAESISDYMSSFTEHEQAS